MSQMSSPRWIDTPQMAEKLVEELRNWPYVGLDTEFYGCDIRTESPVGRTTCHVWSVATPAGPLLPRGFHEANSYVLAGSLLTLPPVQEWIEDARFTKCVHNQPVDAHTIRNHGPILRGGLNTLEMARFWYPERAKRQGFDLDSLGRDFCGAGKTESFDSLLGYDATEEYTVEVERKVCACGEIGCRKRTGLHESVGIVTVPAVRTRKVRRHIPLTDLTPGHPLWERYLAYAAWDAVLALWIYETMLRDGRKERPYPWSSI